MKDRIELLNLYIDGELTTAQRNEVEAKLAACPIWRTEHENLRLMLDELNKLKLKDVPAGLHEKIMKGAARDRQKRVVARVSKVAGAAAAVAALVFVLFAHDNLTRYDTETELISANMQEDFSPDAAPMPPVPTAEVAESAPAMLVDEPVAVQWFAEPDPDIAHSFETELVTFVGDVPQTVATLQAQLPGAVVAVEENAEKIVITLAFRQIADLEESRRTVNFLDAAEVRAGEQNGQSQVIIRFLHIE